MSDIESPRQFPARYRVRIADTPQDVARVLALRGAAFRGGALTDDRDRFDDRCLHLMVEETAAEGALVAACRVMICPDGAAVADSYAAQFYDLGALAAQGGPAVELGRFCVAEGRRDPDILRMAWAGLTRIVDGQGARMLFGCSSFSGAREEPHREALVLLSARHLAPLRWLPRVKAPDVIRFGATLRGVQPDMKRALAAMPPLLRSYLTMGGRVSDHAVVDRDLDTLHVFTGLEIDAIPAARKRLLRAAAGA